jgi:hypothetical protein
MNITDEVFFKLPDPTTGRELTQEEKDAWDAYRFPEKAKLKEALTDSEIFDECGGVKLDLIKPEPSLAFKARAEKFKAERSEAWLEFLDDSMQAGYTIENNLANRCLFMAGYESGKEKRNV